MEQKEQEIKELNQKEMEQAAGGTFTDDKYNQSVYEAAGITRVYHTIAANEFWWNGTDIGHNGANLVVQYLQDKGKQPASLDEAFWYDMKKRGKENPIPGSDLVHMA